MKKIFLLIFSISALPLFSQGTLQDYKRAYSLYDKFKADNVYHWAQGIQWHDSTHVFHYSIQTSEGKRFVTFDVDKMEKKVFQSEKEMRESLAPKPENGRNQRFDRQRRGDMAQRNSPFRQKQRHWMEVDEENEPRLITSPNGKWDAYIEGYNVVLHQVGKPYSQKRVITQDGTIGNYYSNRIYWSPDSRKIFVCKRRAVEKRFAYYVESSPQDQLQPILHKQEYAKPGDELPQFVPCIFDCIGPDTLMNASIRTLVADTALCPNQYSLDWFRWSDDSREVTMEYNQRGHKVYRLLAMSAETGKMRTLIEERSDKFVNYNRLWRQWINLDGGRRNFEGRSSAAMPQVESADVISTSPSLLLRNSSLLPRTSPLQPSSSPTGEKLRNSSILLPPSQSLLWISERDNWNHIYLYDMSNQPTSKKKKRNLSADGAFQITKGNWCVREVIRVDTDEKRIYFTACGVNPDEDPYLIHYYSIKMDGTDMRSLTPEAGNHRAHFSRDWKYLVDTYSLVDRAPVTVLRRVSDGSVVQQLECADLSKIEGNGWVAPEVFTAPGRDGVTPMWGIIQRPTNFDPSKRYPIIEYIYAGPGDAYTPKSFNPYNWNMTALAELGFIVVQLDGMGTSWRGKQFEEVCYKNLKDAGFPDRMAWIKAAAAKYPYMDADHVGIFGASAGGQESTTAVLLHGDFYKAAYSSCGCHDNRMDKIWWNEQWMGYPVDSSYVESSNVYHAAKLERPLMLVVGELDDNVDPASTMQVVDALIRANKDFELVVLPGVHHTMGERFGEHKRYDFFVKNLLNVQPPKWNELK